MVVCIVAGIICFQVTPREEEPQIVVPYEGYVDRPKFICSRSSKERKLPLHLKTTNPNIPGLNSLFHRLL